MGNALNVKMGVCNVVFDGEDLGYTKGGVKISYAAESVEKTVDQEDAPIGEIITKQKFEVKVPMAEYDLEKLALVLPNATLYEDGNKKRLELTGEAGADLMNFTGELVITPVSGSANDVIRIPYAAPKASLEFAFEKENVRVFEVTFVALKGVNGWVTLGDISVIEIDEITPAVGSTAGGTAVEITGFGLEAITGVKFGDQDATTIVATKTKVTCTTPAMAEAGAVDVTLVYTGGSKVLEDAFTYEAPNP